jgi:4-methyl-5(b-hydroxyethyl)-thiazole monophosphate biosynthesis
VSKKVVIVLADGFEEIEAITPIDVLKRAELDVTVAGLESKVVKGSHGTPIETDCLLSDISETPDCIFLPGGLPGSKNLAKSNLVKDLIHKINDDGKTIAAICAAPALVLNPTGLLKGRRATCYPGFEKHFDDSVTFVRERVVEDGNILTSRGPGTALEFSIHLAGILAGEETARQLSKGLLLKA